MDRPLKNPVDNIDAESLVELAQRLLSPSRDCNVQGAAFYRQTIYSLANKTELERVIAQSMQESMRELRPPVQASAPLSPPPAAVAETSLPEGAAQALRSQAKQQYRPALQDPQLLEALLAFHKQTAAPKPAPVRAAAIPLGAPEKDTGGFAHVRAPEIEAQPKSGRYMSRTPGVSRTILRSHDE